VKEIPNTWMSAAAFGAAWGLGEGLGVLAHGRNLVDQPALLLALAVLSGAALALPAVLLCRSMGWVGALVGLLGLELILAVVTDPPPFVEPAWYVGSPIAVVLGALGLAVTRELLRRVPARVGFVLGAIAIMWGLRPPVSSLVPKGERGGPDVVIVTLDTTRADHSSTYGYERETTPQLTALAERGVLFEAGWSPIAVTGPSHATVFSGLGPWEHGVLLNGTPLPELPWLPERLRERGYETAAFVSAYVLDGRYGFDRGFGVYDDDFGPVAGGSDLLFGRLWWGFLRWQDPHLLAERTGDVTVDRALEWWANNEGPRFAWVHLFDAHGPYEASAGPDFGGDGGLPLDSLTDLPPYLSDSLEGRTTTEQVVAEYDREMHFADAQMGRLLAAVGPEAVVLVVGDHGESFGEGGVWFDHGQDLEDHSLHVPMVLAGPGIAPSRRAELTEIGDVPTLVTEALDGRLAEPGPDRARGLAFDRNANQALRAENPGQRPALRMAALRVPDGLAVVHEDGRRTWSGEGDGHAATLGAEALLAGEVQGRDLSDDEIEMLRSLGYIDGLP